MAPLFGKKEEEEEIEETDEEYQFEDIEVKVKFRPSPNHGWRLAKDVEPPLELVEDLFFGGEEISKEAEDELRSWIAEELGGGQWKIELTKAGKTLRSKTINIDDVDIIYGVNKWIVYVKGEESNKWYKADAEFAHPPSTAEIIDQVGGGGRIRIVGYDEKGRIMSSKIVNINVPPPDWLLEREDSFEKKMKEAFKKQLETQQEKLLSAITGDGGQQSSGIDRVIEKLEQLVEEKKLESVQRIIEALERSGKKEEEKKSLSETLFIDPYKAKVKSLTLLIEKFAEKGDIETARQLLNEIPDGSSALISLMTAGANLANAVANMLAGAGSTNKVRRKLDKMVDERIKKKEEMEKEEKKEEEEVEEKAEESEKEEVTESEVEETTEEEKRVLVEERESEDGWDMKLEVEE
ncbi:MAG: hypothetical protein ACXQS2_01860 [Methermicoccaceae archaeon]